MMMMMMMMMCNDLMCTQKLAKSQLNLAHSDKVKSNMTEKNGKHLESVVSVRWVGGSVWGAVPCEANSLKKNGSTVHLLPYAAPCQNSSGCQ